MRLKPFIIVAIIGLAVHRAVAESSPTNSFGIYLFADSEDSREIASNWMSRALAPTPVISEADIVTYTFTNHLMTLTPEAAQRISDFDMHHRLEETFVIVVNGERIYRGAFVSFLSSHLNSNLAALPSITLWGKRQFTIYTNLPPNSLPIERAYSAPFSETEPDPRSDDRIRRALEMLHKLK